MGEGRRGDPRNPNVHLYFNASGEPEPLPERVPRRSLPRPGGFRNPKTTAPRASSAQQSESHGSRDPRDVIREEAFLQKVETQRRLPSPRDVCRVRSPKIRLSLVKTQQNTRRPRAPSMTGLVWDRATRSDTGGVTGKLSKMGAYWNRADRCGARRGRTLSRVPLVEQAGLL